MHTAIKMCDYDRTVFIGGHMCREWQYVKDCEVVYVNPNITAADKHNNELIRKQGFKLIEEKFQEVSKKELESEAKTLWVFCNTGYYHGDTVFDHAKE
jgi:hypothetical protein